MAKPSRKPAPEDTEMSLVGSDTVKELVEAEDVNMAGVEDGFDEFDDDEGDDENGVRLDGEADEDEDESEDEASDYASASEEPHPNITTTPVSLSDIPLIGHSSIAGTTDNPALLDPTPPSKPTPYTHDAGHLLVLDPNPLPPHPTEADLTSTARAAAQSLLNHLLSTCPIHATQEGPASSITMTLPAPITLVPREKHMPVPKAPTKWEMFAKKKGIGLGPGGRRTRDMEGRKVFDEASGEWKERFGRRGGAREKEESWIVEVDEKKEAREGKMHDVRGEAREARKERVRRNERAARANERKTRRGRA